MSFGGRAGSIMVIQGEPTGPIDVLRIEEHNVMLFRFVRSISYVDPVILPVVHCLTVLRRWRGLCFGNGIPDNGRRRRGFGRGMQGVDLSILGSYGGCLLVKDSTLRLSGRNRSIKAGTSPFARSSGSIRTALFRRLVPREFGRLAEPPTRPHRSLTSLNCSTAKCLRASSSSPGFLSAILCLRWPTSFLTVSRSLSRP